MAVTWKLHWFLSTWTLPKYLFCFCRRNPFLSYYRHKLVVTQLSLITAATVITVTITVVVPCSPDRLSAKAGWVVPFYRPCTYVNISDFMATWMNFSRSCTIHWLAITSLDACKRWILLNKFTLFLGEIFKETIIILIWITFSLQLLNYRPAAWCVVRCFLERFTE
jgi:hypothetical protein